MNNLKDFVRLKQVGKGAFGTAWLVESKINPKKYVIKELGHKEMTEREKIDARTEVKLLAKMNHSNIVSYLNSFEEGGRIHILMEYCENGDLGARIKVQNGVPFKEDQILDFFVQICLGIKHIHDNKILHRDIKPQNIFLTRSNVVKLGDFGIAKLMNGTTDFTRTTVGTPFYFSPELCSRLSYNNKSDIWSLGCVLYELCTLNHAFSGQDMAMLALRINNLTYRPISQNYSSGLRLLVNSIFQYSPQKRPNINEILKKPFISRVLEKNCPPNVPRVVPGKDVTPRLQSPIIVNRINSGLNNRKVINKENLIANSPYLPAAKKPMVRKPDNNKVNALIIKKNDLARKGRAAMIINDRENGWKNVLSSPNESKETSEQQIASEPNEKPNIKPVGMYDNYYAELEKHRQQQEGRDAEGRPPIHRFQRIQDDGGMEGLYRKIDHMKNNIPLGYNAGDRDRVVLEYLENKQMAQHIRNRNGAGVALAICGARNIEPRAVPPPTPQTPYNYDEEMANRLNKIRQQNAEERKNQNIGDCALNYDKNKGQILNRENARLALEDIQKKIKQRSEELHQKLAQKRLEKEKDQENEQQKREDVPHIPNNVILFPKRAEPFVPVPRPCVEINKVPDPRMTNVLDQLKNLKPSGDNVKIINTDIGDTKLPSLSMVLNKLREESPSPRPNTAPQPEKLEIKKIKTDILKRLNKNQILLDKVEETDQRKSWALDFDDNLKRKDESDHNLDDTYDNTEDDVTVLSDSEEPSPRPRWSLDHNQPTNMAIELENTRPAWLQNNDFSINIMSEVSDDTIKLEEGERTFQASTVYNPEKSSIVMESPIIIDDVSDQDVDEVLSSTIDRPSEIYDVNDESSAHVINFEAWEKKEVDKIVIGNECVNNDENDKSQYSASSDDDRNEVSMHMRKILEIKSYSSSEDEEKEYVPNDDSKEDMEDSMRQVTHVRSLPNLDEIGKSVVKKAMSESDLISIVNECDSSDSDRDEDEDFSDEKAGDENIFLKIEMIRVKLETEIGLDPLIDAMEFVRESHDLDSDQVAAKLRDMLSNNEDAVNDIFHLIVLEEQYNNMD